MAISRLTCAGFLACVLRAAPALAQPVLFWVSDPVDPGDGVLLTGSDLDSVTAISIAGLADASASQTVARLQQTPHSVKFIVPVDMPPGAWRVTLESAEGRIQQVLNQPTVAWVQGDRGGAAQAGGWLRVFGRNIARRDGARLTLTPAMAGADIILNPTQSDLWSAAFQLPAELPLGVYSASMFNGDAEQPPSQRLSVEIVAPAVGPQTRLDARSFGAKGDGAADDSAAIDAALRAASAAGGGDVLLPAGQYLVTRELKIPAGVRLRGAATDRTSLLWPDFASSPPSLISGARGFAVEDLTLFASQHAEIITGGLDGEAPLPDAADIRVARVRIRASAFRGLLTPAETAARMAALKRPSGIPPFAIRLAGRHVEIIDCDVIASGGSFQVQHADGALITGNRFGSGRLGGYFITGSQRVIFENNLVFSADLQSTGGGINTLGANAPLSQNIYVHANTFTSLLGGDREAMTTDGPRGYYYGRVVRDGVRWRLTSPLPQRFLAGEWLGAAVFVVAGAGEGQWAEVAGLKGVPGRDPLALTLDRELKVALDDTSQISVSPMQRNYLIVGNNFEDTGVAFQTYGTGLDHVIAGNVARRTGGFFLYGGDYHHFQPNWRIQILGNSLSGGNVYRAGPNHAIFSGPGRIAVTGGQDKDLPDLPALTQSVIVRGNSLGDDGFISIVGKSRRSPGVRDVIVEKNASVNQDGVVRIDSGSADVFARLNGGSAR